MSSPSGPRQLLDDLDHLRRALLPLEQGDPVGPGWNLDSIADVVDPARLSAAAVLVGLVARADGPHVLLTRRHNALNRHAGQVAFPGGRIDPQDRDAVNAALRETWEEVAIAPERIEPLGFLDPYATITGFHVLPVVARLPPDHQARPNPDEVAEAFEVPLAPLLAGQRLASQYSVMMGRPRPYWEYQVGPHRIWGATAAMLVNLARRLGVEV